MTASLMQTSSQILHMSPKQVEAFVKAGSAKYGEDRSLTIMDITNAGYGGIYDPQYYLGPLPGEDSGLGGTHSSGSAADQCHFVFQTRHLNL